MSRITGVEKLIQTRPVPAPEARPVRSVRLAPPRAAR